MLGGNNISAVKGTHVRHALAILMTAWQQSVWTPPDSVLRWRPSGFSEVGVTEPGKGSEDV